MNVEIVLQFLLALGLWALIWMERWIQINVKSKIKNIVSFWEMRTFALISFLWALSAWISILFQSNFFLIIPLFILWIFISIYYTYSVFKEKQFWLTTEIATLITFFLWVFVMVWYSQIAIILSIVLTFLLSSKPLIEKIIKKVSIEELNNTLKFWVISVVILPLLPNQKFSIMEILNYIWFSKEVNNSILNLAFLNPYGIWFFVVLMSGISYAWYIMSRVIWEKSSIIASGAIGWLVSSTAVTASMTESSKKDLKNRDLYVVSTLIASTIMFIRVVLIVLFFNIDMLSSIIFPSSFMLVWMILYMVYFYLKSKKKNVHVDNLSFEEKKYKSPFSVWPALKFAWFVLIIKFIAWVGSIYKDIWWDYFFYALWVISWLADVDAISQTMAVDAIDWKVWLDLAAITIIIAVISNNFVKWWIAMRFWEKKFWREVMLWFIISMVMWVIWMVVLNIL